MNRVGGAWGGEAKSRLQLAEWQPVSIWMFRPEFRTRGTEYALRTKSDINRGELRGWQGQVTSFGACQHAEGSRKKGTQAQSSGQEQPGRKKEVREEGEIHGERSNQWKQVS